MSTEHGSGRDVEPTSLTEDSEDHLAFRVFQKSLKLQRWLFGLAGALLLFFGWRVDVALTDVRAEVDGARAELRENMLEAEQDLARMNSARQDLEALAEQQRQHLEQQRTFLEDQRGFLLSQAVRMERLAVSTSAVTGRADSAAVAADLAAANLSSLRDSVQAAWETIDTAWSRVQNRVDSIQQEVFGSWSFVVKERESIRLGTLPLTASMGLINDGVLEGMEIRAFGRLVQAAQDVPLQSTVVAYVCEDEREPARIFEITPTYIVELFLGDDIAGLQVQERRLTGDTSCADTGRPGPAG